MNGEFVHGVHPICEELEKTGKDFKTESGICLGCFKYQPIIPRGFGDLECSLCKQAKVIPFACTAVMDGGGIWKCLKAVENGEDPHQFDPFEVPPTRRREVPIRMVVYSFVCEECGESYRTSPIENQREYYVEACGYCGHENKSLGRHRPE
jgi:hypothetical protein